MQPPDPQAVSSVIDHALPSASASMTGIVGDSLVFSIATAAASAAQTSMSATLASNVAAATTSPGDDESTGECQLLGSWAIVVQAALGAVALLSLVYKRWRERPQRPIK